MTPITTIQPFIDLDLLTVPLNGKDITRDSKGKKKGYSFPSNWQKQFSEEANELSTPIGGLLTGGKGLVAIDCDDTATYHLFKTMDKGYNAFMDSIGKLDKDGNPIECGTILYKATDIAPPSFRGTKGNDIDYFNGTGMVFLPTVKNTTKTTWLEDEEGNLYNHLEQPIEFKEIPQEVIGLLELIKAQPTPSKTLDTTTVAKKGRGFLAKVLEPLDLAKGVYYPTITKILTPKEYRGNLYKSQGHLHPNDIQGSGHMYLFKIACAVASDNTVDKDLFIDLMDYINELWDEPMSSKDLNKSIVAPIVSGRQTNSNGEPYWQYDENWDNGVGFTVIEKRDHALLEVFYDPQKMSYYIYDVGAEHIINMQKRSDLINHLRGISGTIDQKSMDASMDNIHTFSLPNNDYGYFNDDRDFNLFKASEALKILNEPTQWTDNYKIPTEFIAFIEHFIPSEQQRNYFLKLIRTKLTTFGYSPVVPYIIGVQGSGKNTIMTVLQNILGKQYVLTDVGGEQFLEKYNSWLMDKYFIQLNELGDTVTTSGDKRKAQGILKNYTGSQDFECRRMHTDPFTYEQKAMFIMTANLSPLTVEDTDRRLYYISTPNTFDHSPQCLASDPVTVYKTIMAQTNDIAYWLATEFTNLQKQDYSRAPEAEGKQEMIFGSLNSSTKIAWALVNAEFDLLMEWLVDPRTIFNATVTNNKVELTALAEAYHHHSTSDDPDTVMKLAMKSQGAKILFGTGNKPYYIIPHISDYDGCIIDEEEDAEEIDLESNMRS